VIDGASLDDGVDVRTGRDGLGQPLQQQHAHPLARCEATGPRVEWPTATLLSAEQSGAGKRTVLEGVGQHLDRAHESEIAFEPAERDPGLVQGTQGGGAGGV
jgi:hypothetical protein